MTTQTKHSCRAVHIGKARAIEVANRPANVPMPVSQALTADRLSYDSKYKGYGLTACAQPTHSDLYAADLAIERPGCSTRHFLALDYFYTAAEALRYATRWGKLWIDHRLRKVAVSAKSIDTVERNT
jgi:hypothetical protein